ncbi:MAG: Asp-tRNA(Asn)/Glu-tRNA(Gln) amidotransferase subunit GatB [Candidatus Kaelpia aquatica]|nr:Asp-tRNA(Asn)/Glu-tRNA(Gln) amidotransferase subunit GatB [Candidatus Kaelpia aquatica]
MKYKTTIGLEIHIHLGSKTKIFCSCSTAYTKDPNTHTCPVCLGLPGALPVLNQRAFHYAIKAALALNCAISEYVSFDRKNYYYPDLPKNYQISQYSFPVGKDGFLNINGRDIHINRIHMEEDAGKLMHSEDNKRSFVDYNRTGVPLIEIVTEPDIHSPQEAYDFLQELRTTVLYLGISDCNMEEGSLRCDSNISLAAEGAKELGRKIELKNMNTFRGIRQALEHEIDRQRIVLENSEEVVHETRLWDERRQMTIAMRSKEDVHDYRYFPEPDLVKYEISKELNNSIKKELPELPQKRRERFKNKYSLSDYDTELLVKDKSVGDYFEEVLKVCDNPKLICNFITSDIIGVANEHKIGFKEIKLSALNCAKLLNMIEKKELSIKIARSILPELIKRDLDPSVIIEKENLTQINKESDIQDIVARIIRENPGAVEDFKSGRREAIKFLIGQIMKATKGKANPGIANKLLNRELGGLT